MALSPREPGIPQNGTICIFIKESTYHSGFTGSGLSSNLVKTTRFQRSVISVTIMQEKILINISKMNRNYGRKLVELSDIFLLEVE